MSSQKLFWRVGLPAAIALILSPLSRAQKPASPPAAPSETSESRSLTEAPARILKATISLPDPRWNEKAQRAEGPAVSIRFSGPAAPIGRVGKAPDGGAIRISPAVPGTWKWEKEDLLLFFPAAGWLPPESYRFEVKEGLLADDCELGPKTDFNAKLKSSVLKVNFQDRDYYIDPETPGLQQLVTTVDFSQPVSLENLRKHFSVSSVAGIEIFQPGSEPEVIAEPKNPLRFHLRSPLMRPGDKEDLVLFSFREGLEVKAGGKPSKKKLETTLTAYSRESLYFVKAVSSNLRKTIDGDPEQAVLLGLSIPTEVRALASSVEAWKLPPEPLGKNRRVVAWTKENVSDEVLAMSEKLDLGLINPPGSPSMAAAIAFRIAPQPGGKIFVKLAKATAGPGGFVTAEEYREVAKLPPIPKEAALLGNGGLLALNGERKLNVRSRGIDHLRYTVARVQTSDINHLVSQTSGDFESPSFRYGFGFDDFSKYERSVQPIVRSDDYSVNDSSFDFSPFMSATQPGAKSEHGLFHLTVEGVRPRRPEDGVAMDGSVDQDWIPLARGNSSNYNFRPDLIRNSKGSYPLGDRPRDQRFILITDLGLIMKEAADGARTVHVQSFSKQGPVEAVELSVLSKNGMVLHNAVTDGNGRAELPSLRGLQREKTPVALVARKGDDLAFVAWARGDRRLDTSRFPVGGVSYSQESALTASLFTERGIYRPGESIHVGGVVRQRDWKGDLAGMPVDLVVVNAKRDEVGRYPLKLEEGGVLSKTVSTAETAPTGPWRIYLERPKAKDDPARGGPSYLGGAYVRVEEFQPDRLKLRASFQPDAGEGWCSPDDLKVALQVDTLFGLPAAKRRVAATLQLTPTMPTFAKWADWKFGVSEGRPNQATEINLADAQTGKDGKVSLPLNLEAHAAPMLRARVKVEAFEADGGRGVRSELTTLVSRQSYLVGHKTDQNLAYLDSRKPVSVGILAIGPDGIPVGVENLTRVLLHTTHVSVLTKRSNGSLGYESKPNDEVLESVPLALEVGEQALSLPLDRPGQFRYEFRNESGEILCVVPFFVAGRGEVANNLERSGELQIEFEDKEWKPGEELEFSLTTPFAGAGLITIERDTVLEEKWFKSDTKSSVQKIRLPDNLDGGVYLQVVMARALDSPDVFLNPLASGVRRVSVVRAERETLVMLDTPDRVRPGETLKIGYTSEKEGQIAIWAVDEGIHLVSGYQAPDPLRQLLPLAGLEVTTYQLLDVLLPEFSLYRQALAIGGGGGGGSAIPTLKLGLNPFKRRRDAPVVYWSGFVPCGPERGEVFYQVPEYFSGNLKVMAVAVAADSVGVAQGETIVKGDFVLTATTPLSVVPGDEFTATVTVANQLEGASSTDQVRVEVESEGGVEIIDAAALDQSIPVGEELTLRYRCRAIEKLGNAELKFTAVSGASRQETRSSTSVRPGVARAARVKSGWFRGGSHDEAVDHQMFEMLADRRAIVSTTPLGLAHGLSSYLKEYPHGCTEQIVSRAFPWLVLKDDANFGIDREEAARVIADTMNQLSLRLGPKGGFGYWGANEQSGFDYLTVYVGQFLTECVSSDIPVPSRLYQSTLRRLRYMANAKLTDPHRSHGRKYYWRTRWQAEMRAAAIYLLTRNEEVTTNYALKLQDYLEEHVPKGMWQRDSTAAWLAATWRLLKKESAAEPLIRAHRKALAGPLPEHWEYGTYYYNSRLTREATAFTVLCRHFPELARKLSYEDMKPLTSMIEEADFHTLSAAWSVQALKAYAELAETNGMMAGIATVDGQDVRVLAEPAMGQVEVTVPEGMTRFFFGGDSDGGLGAWYQTIETGFARDLPEQADGRHIEVLRELVDADGQVVTQGKLGQTLFAKLSIRNLTETDMPNLALTEMLPGGFEFAPPGEPHSLRPGLASRQGTSYIDVREDRALIYLGLRANTSLSLQYALRPTCAGSFVVPPPYAEDMYESKVRANGAVGRIIILSRD